MTLAQQRKKIAKTIEAQRKAKDTSKYELARGGNYGSINNVLLGGNVTLDLLLTVVNKLGGTIEVKF